MDNHHTDLFPVTTPTPMAPRNDAPAALPADKPRLSATRARWFLVELAASASTLAGMYVGSTTFNGALLYLLSLVFWYALSIKRRLWGLMPLNVATTVVVFLNLKRALQPAAASVGG